MNVYSGIRTEEGCCVKANELDLPLYTELWNHSPTGFEWGYGGSGPAQLALALLAHHTGDPEFATKHHQRFKQEIVAHLDADIWSLTSKQIQDWVDTIEKREAKESSGLVAYYNLEADEPKL